MEIKVKWFSNEKGYGFIEYKEDGNVLVCYSTTKENEYIEIELIITDNGYKIKNISSKEKDQLTGLFTCA